MSQSAIEETLDQCASGQWTNLALSTASGKGWNHADPQRHRWRLVRILVPHDAIAATCSSDDAMDGDSATSDLALSGRQWQWFMPKMRILAMRRLIRHSVLASHLNNDKGRRIGLCKSIACRPLLLS